MKKLLSIFWLLLFCENLFGIPLVNPAMTTNNFIVSFPFQAGQSSGGTPTTTNLDVNLLDFLYRDVSSNSYSFTNGQFIINGSPIGGGGLLASNSTFAVLLTNKQNLFSGNFTNVVINLFSNAGQVVITNNNGNQLDIIADNGSSKGWLIIDPLSNDSLFFNKNGVVTLADGSSLGALILSNGVVYANGAGLTNVPTSGFSGAVNLAITSSNSTYGFMRSASTNNTGDFDTNGAALASSLTVSNAVALTNVLTQLLISNSISSSGSALFFTSGSYVWATGFGTAAINNTPYIPIATNLWLGANGIWYGKDGSGNWDFSSSNDFLSAHQYFSSASGPVSSSYTVQALGNGSGGSTYLTNVLLTTAQLNAITNTIQAIGATLGGSNTFTGANSFTTPSNSYFGAVNGELYVPAFGTFNDVTNITNGITVASSTTLKALTPCWTANDVGKTVAIIGGESGGSNSITTIVEFVNSTNVTLASPVGLTTSGDLVYFGHDDSSGVQRCLTYAGTLSGANINFGSLKYLITTNCYALPNETNLYESQLHFLPTALTSSNPASYFLHGNVLPAPNTDWTPDNQIVSQTGAIIISPLYVPNYWWSILGFDVPTNSGWNFDNNFVKLANLTFRTYPNPAISEINFEYGGHREVDHCVFDAGHPLGFTVHPTSSATALWMPGTGNFWPVTIRDSFFFQYGVGLRASEHALLVNNYFADDEWGWYMNGGAQIPARSIHNHFVACPYGIIADAGANEPCYIWGDATFENPPYSDWRKILDNISDSASGDLSGDLWWQASVNGVDSALISNTRNLNLHPLSPRFDEILSQGINRPGKYALSNHGLNTGLVADWQFQEFSGTNCYDFSGNDNTLFLTSTNGANSALCRTNAGHFGNGLYLDGTNFVSSLDVSSGEVCPWFDNCASFTINVWTRNTSFPTSAMALVTRSKDGFDWGDFYIYEPNSSSVNFTIYTAPSLAESTITASGLNLTNGIWNLISAVYTGNSIALYFDGNFCTNTTTSGYMTNINTAPFDIGAWADGYAQLKGAFIGEVNVLTNHAYTADEVYQTWINGAGTNIVVPFKFSGVVTNWQSTTFSNRQYFFNGMMTNVTYP